MKRFEDIEIKYADLIIYTLRLERAIGLIQKHTDSEKHTASDRLNAIRQIINRLLLKESEASK